MKYILMCLCISFSLFTQEKVIELPLQNSAFVTMKVMFRIGSINDPKGKEGLTYLVSQMLADGASKPYSLKQKEDLLFPMGATFTVSVDKEAVVFTGEVHKDHLKSFYSLFSASLLKNIFSEADFNRLKDQQKNVVTTDMIYTDDERLSKRVLEQELFKGHPYAHLVEGTESGVSSITRKDVLDHYTHYFTKNNLILGIAGGYTSAFKDAFVADFAKLPEGKNGLIELPKPEMPSGVETTIVAKENTFGSAIFMGFPYELTRSSNDFAAMMVMNSWFGEHRKAYSYLYQRMREDRSLNYGDYSYLEWYPNGGRVQLPLTGTPRRSNYFSIWIRPVQIAKQLAHIKGVMGQNGEFIPKTEKNKLDKKRLKSPELGQAHFVIRQALYELDKLVFEGLSEEEFALTRDFVRGYIKQYIRTQELRLGYLMDSYCYGREDFITEMDKALATLTLNDVNTAIKKYLSAKNMYVAVITDTDEAKTLETHIKKNKRSPIIYKPSVYVGLSQKLLNEDIEILRYTYKKGEVKQIDSKTLFK